MSKAVQEMFRRICSRYDLANDILSLGIHRRWRKLLGNQAELKDNQLALDICTGTGEVALELNRKFPKRIYAMDFVTEMVQSAVKKNEEIHYFVGDALKLPFKSNSFGLVTISFGIRNLDSPIEGLKEIYRILTPDSKVLILEFGQNNSSLFGKLYNPYARHIIPFLGGLITGDRAAYEYLPETSARFPAREDFIMLMEQTGFKQCSCLSLFFGIAYLYTGRCSKEL
jgi:demethylmenaquinone methyltransferase/2-methoxy-6-polyprenyl-1,4-benzoquinol methylase